MKIDIPSVLLLFFISTSRQFLVSCGLTPHQILNIPRGASQEQIKKAYRKLAKQYHPDKNPNNPNAEKKFIAISNAYEELMNGGQAENEDIYSHHHSRRAPQDFQRQYQHAQEQYYRQRQQQQRQRQQRHNEESFYYHYRSSSEEQPFYYTYSSSSSSRSLPVDLFTFLLQCLHFLLYYYPYMLCVVLALTFFFFYSLFSCCWSCLFATRRKSNQRTKSSNLPTRLFPLWSPTYFEKGKISVVIDVHDINLQKEVLQLVPRFKRDPISFFCTNRKIRVPQSKVDKDQSNVEESIKNVMVALAKGGRKWTVRPAGEETESWLLRMLGGEVAWIEDSEDTPCPIQ